MPQTSSETKKLIIKLHLQGNKPKVIAAQLEGEVKLCTIYKTISKHKALGYDTKKRTRAGKVTQEISDFINKYIDENRFVILTCLINL